MMSKAINDALDKLLSRIATGSSCPVEFPPQMDSASDSAIDLLLRDGFYSEYDTSGRSLNYLHSVKIVHSSDLKTWQKFPKWQEHNGMSLYDFKVGKISLDKLINDLMHLIKLQARLNEIDNESLTEYQTHALTVNRSFWGKLVGRGQQYFKLPRPKYDLTVLDCTDGNINGELLFVKAGFFRKEVVVTYKSPSCVVHRDEINSLNSELSRISEEDRKKAQTIIYLKSKKYDHPLLFISHRWTGSIHPDDNGKTLERLKALDNCFIIYDYSSFPQEPRSPEREEAFAEIVSNMGTLIRNAVILKTDDYLTRGWCLYEYIVASLSHSIVCDEVNDAVFRDLRNWTSTEAVQNVASHLSLYGWKSLNTDRSVRDNFKNERIIETVNRIVPMFKGALFTKASDKELVKDLLLKVLKKQLPPKSEYIPYMGEWKTKLWSDEELLDAFDKPLKTPREQTFIIKPNNIDVPASLCEAVRRKYNNGPRNQKEPFLSGPE